MPDIRANRVPQELVKTIKKAILDREVPSIREATIEAFELWLAADGKARPAPQPGPSSSQDRLNLCNIILGDLESAYHSIDNAINNVRATAAQASASGQSLEDGVVPRKTTRRRKA